MSDLNPIQYGARPAAPLAAANMPDLEAVIALAEDMTLGLLPGGKPAAGSGPPSPPGVGINLDIYAAVDAQTMGAISGGRGAETMSQLLNGEFAQGLATAEPLAPPPDFPYLKPLGGSLGQVLNALV